MLIWFWVCCCKKLRSCYNGTAILFAKPMMLLAHYQVHQHHWQWALQLHIVIISNFHLRLYMIKKQKPLHCITTLLFQLSSKYHQLCWHWIHKKLSLPLTLKIRIHQGDKNACFFDLLISSFRFRQNIFFFMLMLLMINRITFFLLWFKPGSSW
jgi:hypothetical protein